MSEHGTPPAGPTPVYVTGRKRAADSTKNAVLCALAGIVLYTLYVWAGTW